MTTFTKEELNAIKVFAKKTRESKVLQLKTGLGYLESDNLIEKVNQLLRENESSESNEETTKNLFSISIEDNMMIIEDIQNNIEYKIDENLVDEGKIADYTIEERKDSIDNIETWIGESHCESDKFLMREDLEMLMESSEEYVISYYATNGFICKDIDIKKFNETCSEIIESFVSYRKAS